MGKHLGPGESGEGETFGDKDFDDISIDITMCSLSMDEAESFGRMFQCIWLQVIDIQPILITYI